MYNTNLLYVSKVDNENMKAFDFNTENYNINTMYISKGIYM